MNASGLPGRRRSLRFVEDAKDFNALADEAIGKEVGELRHVQFMDAIDEPSVRLTATTLRTLLRTPGVGEELCDAPIND